LIDMTFSAALLSLIGLALAVATLPLLVELLVLSVAALLPSRIDHPEPQSEPMPITVVIPAHNEEVLIARCVHSVLKTADAATEVLVVAHNCRDATVAQAETAGANLVLLNDPTQTGKGAALNHGFTAALARGAQAVVVIDADSVVDPGLITAVRQRLQAGARALQCRYEARNCDDNQWTNLMALALCGVNVVRPRGRARLGLSAGILGNGFALHRDVLAHVPYDAQSVVEDLEYHLKLIVAGVRVEFVDSVAVRGEMPVSTTGARTQRARWEGGRLGMMRRWTPRLLMGVLRGQLRYVEPVLDLMGLPIASAVILLVIAASLPVLWVRLYVAGAFAVLLLHITAAALSGRGFWATVKALSIAPSYVLWKLSRLPEIWRASRSTAAWVRTDRSSSIKGR
jgi:cellulose synthase/poly-beta-1,6-N-acetylglucosamine synthase-like glycosyltransferase